MGLKDCCVRMVTYIMPARYMFAVLASISFSIIYGLKVNLSVTIVAMVNRTYNEEGHSTSSASDETLSEGIAFTSVDGPFKWSETLQGLILAAYFWGYFMGQLPGGRVSELYSAKWVMLFGVVINIVGCACSPIGAGAHYGVFIFLRVLQGFGGGVTFPAMHVMLSHWAPVEERSVITAIVYAGTSLGTVISMMLSGQLIASLGWEWVFYIMAMLSGIWCILWLFLIKDTPATQPFIKDSEKEYISTSLGEDEEAETEKPPVPWKIVFTSLPFYAILITHFGSNCGWYMLLTQLPSYMQNILHFKIKENAMLSAMPYFVMWLFSIVLSRIIDTCRSKELLTIGQSRKICTGIATVIPAMCFVGVGFVGSSQVLGVLCMTIAITAIGGMFCGFLANHIDIAPHFAGTLMAITNTVGTIPGITVPVLVGYLTEGNQTINQWRIIFFGTAMIYIIIFIVYTLFASGELQPWNEIRRHSVLMRAPPPASAVVGVVGGVHAFVPEPARMRQRSFFRRLKK